ncbi:non-ribosomal peptide synthetase [Actinocrinis sp.]|uniref:non-ribosomal peptide synthetase n=1 Tax=Actinocrinis sp. TaxID=1920516 RepID=UPI002D2CC184|nr:non-ribosomal peptide synthetase [Actinocrinis sp.]HZP50427.1 non-ribosomal peptide synthetase [Actinocrinis sp.]
MTSIEAPDLLRRLAAIPAERTAVVAAERTLDFGALRAEAGRIARRLAARGVGPGSVVALALPRGADLITALIGTLTAGAAYLPVDPRLPADRRRYLVDDAAVDVVIVADDEGADAPSGGADHVPYADLAAGPASAEAAFEPVAVHPDELAYVIYTSGSTGRPKGVEISRGAAAALLAELEQEGLVSAGTGRVGWNASPSFDASVQQWVRVCRGDAVVMIDEETRADPQLLAGLIERERLTDLDITPSHADALLDLLGEVYGRDPGRAPLTLLVGGEPISPALWRRIGRLVDDGVLRAVNVYGPTECTVDSTAGWIASGDRPHIGSVLPGLRMRLLDEALRPVPDGETGELYLAGPRVGRGYRGRPGLTAERFVADAGSGDETAFPGTRMYRTGDLCRRTPDGRLEYIGRADGQVKLRGHRIELGEIESVLADHPAVAEAAVALRDDVHGAAGLVAYVRAEKGGVAGIDELREHLSARLPGYMVPAAFVPVDSFPTTPNGKLDRAALPEPPADPGAADPGAANSGAASTSDAASAAADEPTGPVEQLIARVWAQVLGAPRIGAEDNFFKLGGHSLLAIKLVAGVRSELGLGLPVKAVYENPRLRDLAVRIESMLAEAGARPEPALR